MVKIKQQYAVSTLISVALHVVLFGVLLIGWKSQVDIKPIKRPNYVQASLVSLEQKSKTTAQKVEKQQPNKVDLTKKRQEAEALAKKKEEQRLVEIKKREAQKRKEEQAKAAKIKREKEQAEKERLTKEKAERERRKAEEQRLQQERQQLNQALLDEERQLREQANEVEAQSYIGAITRRIEQNWSRPPSARNGMSCELMIGLVPTGRVVSVNVIKSSGNIQFDRSAEQAVKKAEQFPEIKEMKPEVFEKYYRELKLVFTPQDLRL